MSKTFYIYILASNTRMLYTGLTSRLDVRVLEHRRGVRPGFTRKYRVTKLVYYELTTDPRVAVARERQIKSWSRQKRLDLVEGVNPEWVDLAAEWFGSGP